MSELSLSRTSRKNVPTWAPDTLAFGSLHEPFNGVIREACMYMAVCLKRLAVPVLYASRPRGLLSAFLQHFVLPDFYVRTGTLLVDLSCTPPGTRP